MKEVKSDYWVVVDSAGELHQFGPGIFRSDDGDLEDMEADWLKSCRLRMDDGTGAKFEKPILVVSGPYQVSWKENFQQSDIDFILTAKRKRHEFKGVRTWIHSPKAMVSLITSSSKSKESGRSDPA